MTSAIGTWFTKTSYTSCSSSPFARQDHSSHFLEGSLSIINTFCHERQVLQPNSLSKLSYQLHLLVGNGYHTSHIFPPYFLVIKGRMQAFSLSHVYKMFFISRNILFFSIVTKKRLFVVIAVYFTKKASPLLRQSFLLLFIKLKVRNRIFFTRLFAFIRYLDFNICNQISSTICLDFNSTLDVSVVAIPRTDVNALRIDSSFPVYVFSYPENVFFHGTS